MTATLMAAPGYETPTIRQLANGLTIIAQQMPVEAVTLNLWLKVGSAYETDEINGMAHFLEHMVFKGTARLANGEFERRIEARGAVTNAATSQEYTQYYITAAPQDFAELAPLQLEVVTNPRLDTEAFERERLVVLEEIRRAQDNPRRRAFSQAMEVCFEQLPYRRPILGPPEAIAQFQVEQMRQFHAAWYQPQNMVAAIAGNLPVEEAIAIVSEGMETAVANPLADSLGYLAPEPGVMLPEAPFSFVVRRESVDSSLQQARLMMLWRVPGLLDLSETYALDVLAVILAQGRTSRLHQELREERGLVSQIGASNLTHRCQGAFSIAAHLDSKHLAAVEAAIAAQIRRLQSEPISEAELARIRTQVANRFIFNNERPGDRTHLHGYYYSQLGELEAAFAYPGRIQSLSAADIQACAQRYLSSDAYGIVTLRPPDA
ncbi:MAG: insulinase family protein [Chloroflexaceae bacterium]|nr:insulinase family protein [Chloroflexaceae bacterium]